MKSVGGTTKALNLKMLSRLHHKWVPPLHLFFRNSYPPGKAWRSHLLRSQGFAVEYYSGNLGALKLEPSRFLQR